jgi:hypothetical protein
MDLNIGIFLITSPLSANFRIVYDIRLAIPARVFALSFQRNLKLCGKFSCMQNQVWNDTEAASWLGHLVQVFRIFFSACQSTNHSD